MVAVVVVIFNPATVVVILAMMPPVIGVVLARSTIELHTTGANLQTGCVIALPLFMVSLRIALLSQNWQCRGSSSYHNDHSCRS